MLFKLPLEFLAEMQPPTGTYEDLVPAFAAIRDQFEVLFAALQQQSTNQIPIANLPSGVVGVLIGRQVFDTAGTFIYNPTAGTSAIDVELQGAGAGGSGVASAGVNQVNLGGGGGGGAYLLKRLGTNFSGAIIIVGAKGAGGAAGNNNGADGSPTIFTATAGTVYTAGGGIGGQPRTSFAPPITTTVAGGTGGTATNGDLNIFGDNALLGIAPNQFVGWASIGAKSRYGPYTYPTQVVNSSSFVGFNGTGYGTGGSGAVSSNAGGAKAGGDGTGGIVTITEYS